MQNSTVHLSELAESQSILPELPAQGMPVLDPFDGQLIAHVADESTDDMTKRVSDAHIAFLDWSQRSVYNRCRLMDRWYELIIEHKEPLGRLLSLEQGKPLKEAIGEVLYGASFVRWFAQEGPRSYGRIIPNRRTGFRSEVYPQPVGVCVAITPWNFPNAMITRKVAPALVAGCSILVKPAEQTPLSALALQHFATKAGLPNGLFQVVTTSDPQSIGQFLCTHPMVRKISFTGSTPVGSTLMGHAAKGIKRISLELGGNAPFIIFDDADIQEAVKGLVLAKFRNSGQTCVSPNRVYVQRSCFETVLELLLARLSSFSVGRGLDDVTIGPLIEEKALNKVERLIEDALAKGAKVHTGGTRSEWSKSVFLPTIMTEMNEDMDMAKEEIFGPVLPIYLFDTEEEVIERSNAIRQGLAAYFYSNDAARIERVATRLESGMVGVNTGFISDAATPFGGVKESGIGREGAIEGLQEYQEIKYVCKG